MKKLILLIMITIFSFSYSQDIKSYRIGMSEWIPWITLNVAEKKGFWKSEGIDIKVILYDDYYNMLALLDGEIDFSIDMLGAWYSQIVNKKEITILSENDWSNGGDILVERKGLVYDKIIYTYTDKLAGLFFLDKVLSKQNKSLNDYTIVRFDPAYMNDGYRNGTMNLVLSYEPDVREIIKMGGTIISTSADFAGVMPDGIAIMNNRLKEIPRQDIVKFYKGLIKAHEWVCNSKNKKEMFNIIRKNTLKSSVGLSDIEIEQMLDNVIIPNKKEFKLNNTKNGNLYKYSKELSLFYEKRYKSKIDFTTSIDTSYIDESFK